MVPKAEGRQHQDADGFHGRRHVLVLPPLVVMLLFNLIKHPK
jgi:hypothetical protein